MDGRTGGASRRRALLAEVLERVSIRGVLLVGFGLLLALWLVSGGDLVRRVAEVENRTSDVHRRFLGAEEQLLTVRTQILLGSVYLRDALLDTPDQAEFYRERLQGVRSAIDLALDKYQPLTDSPSERETLGQLRAETQDFWETTLPALRWDTERRATQARAWLLTRVVAKRQDIVSISERVQGLNRAAYEEQQAELGRIYSAMRRRVWETSVAVLLLGIGIAFVVIGYAGRLEAKIREQRLRERENTRNLQRLSAKLVNAQEEERRSIARELHDEIGQALTAIKVELAVVERALDTQARTRNVLGEARAITDHALQTVRDLSQLLHPPLLDDLGLAATLDWYLGSFSKRTGIAAELLREEADERLAPEIEMCLYRITQEALTNVAKHANATSCRVYLQRLTETVRLKVEDNGKGFDVRQVMARHLRSGLGLLGVQERVSEFGGTFRIESEPGQGTRLIVELPALPREQAEPAAAADGEPGREPAPTGEIQ